MQETAGKATYGETLPHRQTRSGQAVSTAFVNFVNRFAEIVEQLVSNGLGEGWQAVYAGSEIVPGLWARNAASGEGVM